MKPCLPFVPLNRISPSFAALAAIATIALVLPSKARAESGLGVVAVYSSASPAYARTALADGSFKPESYALGEGACLSGGMNDPALSRLSFRSIAEAVANPLATQNYQPARDPRQANLLIVVYWGMTQGTNGTRSSAAYQMAEELIPAPTGSVPVPQNGWMSGQADDPNSPGAKDAAMEYREQRLANDDAWNASIALTAAANQQRDLQDAQNARLLGYLPEMAGTEASAPSALRAFRQDVVAEVEENRYFVVLMAYDFQKLWKQKERKLLWETRFSVREPGTDFGAELAAMAERASGFFGRNSDGLVRRPFHTKITIGTPSVVAYSPDTKK
jgi:hypothetical protein